MLLQRRSRRLVDVHRRSDIEALGRRFVPVSAPHREVANGSRSPASGPPLDRWEVFFRRSPRAQPGTQRGEEAWEATDARLIMLIMQTSSEPAGLQWAVNERRESRTMAWLSRATYSSACGMAVQGSRIAEQAIGASRLTSLHTYLGRQVGSQVIATRLFKPTGR